MLTQKKINVKQLEKKDQALSNKYIENYPQSSVEDLLWTRKYHATIIKDIDSKLMKLSREHKLTVPLENDSNE